MVVDQVGLPRDDVERRLVIIGKFVVLPQRGNALAVPMCTFEGTINDGTLPHVAVTKFPALADV